MTRPIPEITAEALYDLMRSGRPFHLLNVLPGEFFEDKHLPAARNACVYEMVFLDTVREMGIETSDTVVVYGTGRSSEASTTAAGILRKAGFSDVHDLKGGIEDWEKESFPLEGEDHQRWNQTLTAHEIHDGILEIDCVHSKCEWTGRNLNGKHFGTVPIHSGQVTVRDDVPTEGEVVLDMTGLECADLEDQAYNQMLIGHLESADFFLTAKHPEARIEISKVTPVPRARLGSPNFNIDAQFTLRGVTGPISFPATILRKPDGSVSAEAHFDFDRTEWGIVYGSGRIFEMLGKHLVDDRISIDLRLLANPK